MAISVQYDPRRSQSLIPIASPPNSVHSSTSSLRPVAGTHRTGACRGGRRGGERRLRGGGGGDAVPAGDGARPPGLVPRGQKNRSASDDENDGGGGSSGGRDRSGSFIVRGGCPFKSFHRERPSSNNNSSKRLARAMEDFSLAAIMGRIASESNVDWEEGVEEEEQLSKEEGKNDENSTVAKGEDAADNDEQLQGDGSTQQTQQGSEITQASLLSQALKTGTAESHTAAENVHFVNNFVQGKIDRALYQELVARLYHTYVALERLLDTHAPTHFPTLHFPKELSRVEALKEDMEYWHGPRWESAPAGQAPSPALRDYVERMEEVGRIDPLLLLSHAYTRYLGDLSGGKVLARIARRALNLGKGHDGLQFYNFQCVKSAKLFKDKYREALDVLVLDADQVGRLVAEANVAFALNMRVFEELDVKGGVPGARVRDVGEALSYYDVEMDRQRRGRDWGESFSSSAGEEAKCPFGYVGGASPLEAAAGGKKKGDAPAAARKSDAPKLAIGWPSNGGLTEEKATKEGEGRCPWPFVFFHDPATGMRDWQTWLVIGLAMCWCWSVLNGVAPHDSIDPDEAAAEGAGVRAAAPSGADLYGGLSYLDWFMQ